MSVAAPPKSLSREATDWQDLVFSALSAGRVELPLLPRVALRVLQLVESHDSNVRTLCDLVQKDPVLASRVLRLANSVLYGTSREITCLREAVVRMGFEEVRNVVVGLGLSQSVQEGEAYGDWGHSLHEHSMGAAYCAQTVAQGVGADPSDAFIAGLFHDLGKLALLKVAFDLEKRGGLRPPEGALDDLLERRHAWAGAHLLRTWRVPDEIQEAVRFHHEPGECRSSKLLATVVHAADRMCHAFGFGCEPLDEDLAADPVFRTFRFDSYWVEFQRERLPGVLEVALESFVCG